MTTELKPMDPKDFGVGQNAGSVDSASDARVINNVMRHEYRVLTETEKRAMQAIKDIGLSMHVSLETLGNSRELALAKTKNEETVMWAVKHLTK